MNRLQSLKMKLTRVLTVIPVALLLAIGVVGTVVPEQAYAASSSVPEMIPSTGKDYWLTFMQNREELSALDLKIFILSEKNVTVTVTAVGGSSSWTESVAAGVLKEVVIPTNSWACTTSSGLVTNTGVHLQATEEFSVFSANIFRESTSAISYDLSPVIATTSLGTEYFVQTYPSDKTATEFSVVGTEDGTTVKIVVSRRAKNDGGSAFQPGDTIKKTLNAGQVIQLKSINASTTLSGSAVIADKKVAVFAGGVNAGIPDGGAFDGDHVFEQVVPASAAGKRFVLMNFNAFPSPLTNYVSLTSEPTRFCVTGLYAGTKVKLIKDGVATEYNLNRGNTLSVSVGYNENPKFLEASNSVLVNAYLPNAGQNMIKRSVEDDYGDYVDVSFFYGEPSMVLIPATRQGVKKAVFPTFPEELGGAKLHYVNVIVPDSAKGDFKLNGVAVSASAFSTSSNHFIEADKDVDYAYARLQLTKSYNVLENDKAPFLAFVYGLSPDDELEKTKTSPEGYAMATTFNLAPAAPIVKIDNDEVSHGAILKYCNKHPGVEFSAIVDYPHDSIRWELGDNGVTSTSINASHMYGKTVNEADTTHNVRFYVYHHSPILPPNHKNYKDTDSVCVSLTVHPVYYDTLRDKVAANKLEYIWNKSSNPAFGIAGKGQQTLTVPVTFGKDAPNANNKWTTTSFSDELTDSIVYLTRHDCDSIFYIKLTVVPDIIMPEETQTVCQGESFAWAGHTVAAGHRLWRKVGSTWTNDPTKIFSTDEVGTFEIRDTLVSKVYPNPDSIHVLTLTVNVKPSITLTEPSAICQTDDDAIDVSYTVSDATSFQYWLKDGSDHDVITPVTINAPFSSSFNLSGLSGLAVGTYTLKATATSAAGCTCDATPVTIRIKDKPTLTLNAIDAKCYPASSFDVTYTYANTTKIYYQVKNGTTPMFTDWQEVTSITGTFNISTSGWAAGTYSIEAYAEKEGCTSVHDVSKSLTITVQPTVVSLKIDTVCDAEANTTVRYRTANADTCYYYIRSQGKGTLKGVKKANDAVLDFTLNVSALNTNGLVDLIDTLYFVTDASCPGDTVKVPIVLHPMPTAKITAAAPTQCFTNISGNLEISYERSGVTNKVDWQLSKDNAVVYTQNNWTTASKLVIPAAQLTTPGNYQVKINKAYSTQCDSTGLKKGTLAFVLYDTAHITLSNIDPVCEGTAVANNAYTASSIKSFKYWVDTVAGATPTRIAAVTVNSDATSGSINMAATAGLPAGNYVLRVQAKNDGCGEASVISKPFTIEPMPTLPVITSDSASLSKCVSYYKATDMLVGYTTTANSIKWELKQGGSTVITSGGYIAKAANIIIPHANLTKAAKDYVLTITGVKTTFGCEVTTPVSVKFALFDTAKIVLDPIASVCPGTAVTATYTPTNVSSYIFRVDTKGGVNKIPNTPVTTINNTIDLSATASLPEGEYVLYVTASNNVPGGPSCEGAEQKMPFTINPKPTVSISGVTSECKGTNPTVTLTSLNAAATHYIYWIDNEGGTQVKAFETPTAVSTTFAANVSGLDPGKYRVRVQTSNGTTGCTSVVATSAAFEIYPLPLLTLNPNAVGLNVVYLQDTKVVVPYVSTNTKTYDFTFAKNDDAGKSTSGSNITAQATGDSVRINISDTEKFIPGTYTLTVTPKSDMGCTVAPSVIDTIKIEYPTDIRVLHIDSICEKESPVVVPIQTKYANGYEFVVKDGNGSTPTGGSGTGATVNEGETWKDASISLTTTNWPAGLYTITVTATNSLTHSSKTAPAATFRINPTPKIAIEKPFYSVCKGTSSVEVKFTPTAADSVNYYFKQGATTIQIDGKDDKSILASTGKITLDISALDANTYTLYTKPFSKLGCQDTLGYTQTKVYINPLPEITLTNVELVSYPCEQTPKLTITYTASTNARTYAYILKDKDGTTVPNISDQAIPAPYNGLAKTFDLDLTGLTAAKSPYKMTAVATSDSICEGAISNEISFSMLPKPTITNVSIDSICDNETQTELRFKIGNLPGDYDYSGVTYTYEVVGYAALTNTATAAATNAISVTNLGALTPGLYTINLKVNTPTCESEQATAQFRIWPLPVVSITKIDDVCFGDAQTTVTCSPDANVSKCTYTLKLGGTPVTGFVDKEVTLTDGKFTIATNTLGSEATTTPYTVELTPYSGKNCTGEMKSATFKVNALPTLGDINLDATAVCEGTATMGASFAHTGADSCHWELYLKDTTTPVLRQGNKNGLTDGTTNISIDLLAPTALEAGKEYDLKVIMVNTATKCEQTKPVVTFLIRKNPTVELASVGGAAQIEMCQPVDSVKFHYTNTGATEFIYKVEKGGTEIKSGTMTQLGTAADSVIRFGSRLLKGDYTLSIKPKNTDCTNPDFTVIPFKVDTVLPKKTTATICYGETFDWYKDDNGDPIVDCNGNAQTLMKGLTVSRHQFDTIFCADGCNKVYELDLTVKPKVSAPLEKHTLCINQTLTLPDGQLITKAGSYEYKTDDGAGCFIYHPVEVSQIIPEVKTINQSVCYGTPVVFSGKTYTGLQVGKHELRDTVAAIGGCDSVYVLMNLTVGERYYDSIVVTECDHYLWHGTTYKQSGIYREELASVDGCDSVSVLNLTINPRYEFTESYDILDTQLPFTVHEFTYEAAGTYDREFSTVAGCDSIYHITITTHTEPLPKDTTVHTMCEGATYSWQGTDYTVGGWYSKTEPGVAIHVLHLTVNPKYSNTTYVHHCGDSYMWQGTPRTASGTYTWEGHSLVTGCDSTEILVLTLGQANTYTVNITACRYEPVNVGSKTFLATEASYDDMTETFTNASGCDSTVTYKIHVTDRTYDAAVMDAFCEGTPYIWDVNGHTHTYTEAGTYFDTVMTDGCATKISTLELTANPKYHFEEDVEVWENALPYEWTGHKADTLLKTDGDYYDNHTTAEGCDSIYHIHFHVNWYERDTTYTEANPDLGCGSYTWNGKTYTQSCLASDTVGNKIEFRYIVITQQYSVVEPEFTICTNTPFEWHGSRPGYPTKGDKTLTYTVPQKYKGQTVAGCDSTYTVTVHVVETFHSEQTYAACPSELPYNWRGQLLTTDGDYTDVVPSPTGCDSTYVIHFTVTAVTGPDEVSDVQCLGAQINWGGLDFTANEPGEFEYYNWYKPNTECPDYETYHKLNLTVGQTYVVDSALTKHVCDGTAYPDWFGQECKVEGADVVTLNDHLFMKIFHKEVPTALGCDSLKADLTLYAHKKYEKTLPDTTICNKFIWDGETVTTDGDEITYVRTYNLYPELGECGDSILTRKFTVLHSETETITKNECDSYFWDKTNTEYTESGTYTFEEMVGGQCPKITYLELTIRKKGTKEIEKEACYSYTWTPADGGNGQTYSTSGIYDYKLDIPSVSGCDSIHYLNLTIKDSVVTWLDPVTACDSYEWKGTSYGASKTIRYVTEAANGCDSIVYLPLTINHKSETFVPKIEACGSYDDEEHNIHLTASDPDYIVTLTNAKGCDSIVHFNIEITQPTLVEHTFTACDNFTWNSQTYTTSGDYEQEFLTPTCDSIVTLHLTIGHTTEPTNVTVVTYTNPYIWAEADNEEFTASGDYTRTLHQIASGCDSVVNLHLIINDPESPEVTDVICSTAAPYVWQAFDLPPFDSPKSFTESGDYSDTLHIDNPDPLLERDSVRWLHLTIQEPPHTELTAEVCDTYVWGKDGQEYTISGTYLHDANDGVCDYTDTLHLTIHYSAEVTVKDTACDLMTINGITYDASGEYVHYMKTPYDCDSTVTYQLKINHRKTQTLNEDACGSYDWEGTTYTASGSYTRVLETADGCDSVVTLNLSIHRPYSDTIQACGYFAPNGTPIYVWDNRTYYEAGDHVWNYTSVRGCDSTVVLRLTMPVVGEPESVQACDKYLWNGRLLTASGAYTDTLTSLVTGCDSVAKLYLAILPNPAGEQTWVEQTSSYTWGGVTYYESGDYERRFPMEEGCDSIATLHLTINDPMPISYEFSAEACDAYTWDTETFYESGVYVRNFPTLDDRDSIVKLTLTIRHDTTVYRTDKLCGPYDWNGQIITETGTYSQALQRASGCDSLVTLTLTLCERFETSFVVEANDVFTWDGRTYTESTTETRQYVSRQGCDSLVTMVLTIIKTANTEFEQTACTEFAWADSLFTESTIHSHIFPASVGGDSIVTMKLIIHEPVYADLVDTVREPECSTPGYEYELPWGEKVQHTGIYTHTLESQVTGCDSIIRFHLQWCDEELCIDTLPVIAVEQCGPYTWDKTGEEYSVTGTYDYHERDALTGCEHVSLLRLNILPQVYRTIDTTACDSLYWEEKSIWIKESGYYRDTVFGGAADGCDSITIRHAIIGHAAEETIEVTSCDAYTLNGETFNESGTYIQHLTTVTGCDSTLTINLTLNPTKQSTDNGTTCDDTVWYNLTLTETGFYPQVLQTTEGCDSVVTLNLIVYNSKQIEYIDSTHCDSILWGPDREGNDTLIVDDGIYTRTFTSSVGCDSTVTMDLRLKRKEIVFAPDTQACDSLVWNDKVYYVSGTFNDTTVSTRTGCDSITTMHITIDPTLYDTIYDTVPPPFFLWPTENDTIWESGEYVDTVPSLITGCDSITTLYLVMTDSIILDSIEPVRIDTLGYCPGDTVNLLYNLLKGHPTKYNIIFEGYSVLQNLDPKRDFISVTDTAALPNHGMDTIFTLIIPELCPPGTYNFDLQMFDDYSSSEVYHYHLIVAAKSAIVAMWTDVVAINNIKEEYIGYQWYKDNELIPGATKQYYSDGEDLNACYRAKVQLAKDSSWVFTCEECFDLRTDSLELIAYPTPAPVGQPVTIKALGILLEKLNGSRLTITNVQGLTIKEYTLTEGQRGVDVELSAGLYIATLATGNNDDKGPRTAAVKFTVY